jgi:hypothetical protein
MPGTSTLTTALGYLMSTDWLGPLATGAITATAAVIAVLITQRGEHARLHEDRLWKERAALYVELLAWANDVNAWALRRPAGPGEPASVRPSPLPRLMHARVLAFAGPMVQRVPVACPIGR